MQIGDFVMFRKLNSQWGHCRSYSYGMIVETYHRVENRKASSRKMRCDIFCTDGTIWTNWREDRIIILAKGKY